MDETITFEIEKTETYDCVTVTKNDDTPEKGFIKCTHAPSNGHTYAKSCVKYKKCHLKTSSTSEPIDGIQDQIYDSITVFLVKKNKNNRNDDGNGDGSYPLPLMIVLNKNSSPNHPEYYIHKNDGDNGQLCYWTKLSGCLKEMLPQMGLGISSSQLGHGILKRLLERIGISVENGKDMANKLSSIQPYNLKRLLDQQISEYETRKTLLMLILSVVRFDLTDSVVILLEKRCNEKYDADDLKKIIKTKGISTIKNQKTTVCDDKEEEEEDDEDEAEEEVVEHDYDEHGYVHAVDLMHLTPQYKHCTHTISSIESQGDQTNNSIEMSFFIHKTKIETYNENGTEIEYVCYDKSCNIVTVVFFDWDPRPLLFCYNDKAYRPKCLSTYYTKWVRTKKITSFDFTNIKENKDLIDVLTEVDYHLNPVKLEVHTNNAEEARYITHTFHNSVKTMIGIDIMSSDMNFYKDCTHEPGIPGYVLGEITHNGSKLFDSYEEYKKSNNNECTLPDSVSVYYFMFDFDYEYPLMVMLHYAETQRNDYYKLIQCKPPKWKKMLSTGADGSQDHDDKNFIDKLKNLEDEINELVNKLHKPDLTESLNKSIQREQEMKHRESNELLERKLDDIRKNLDIKYTESEDHLIIKHPQIAVEKGYIVPLSVTLFTLSLILICAGIVYYKYSKKVLYLYRQLF